MFGNVLSWLSLQYKSCISKKSQLVWKLIYARHASNYIHETGTYRAKTQCTNTRKTKSDSIVNTNLNSKHNLPLSFNFLLLKAL